MEKYVDLAQLDPLCVVTAGVRNHCACNKWMLPSVYFDILVCAKIFDLDLIAKFQS